MIYGPAGVGKSTLGSQFPKPIVIQTEEGMDDIGTDRFPLCKNTEDFKECIRQLIGVMSEDKAHDYETIVVDSLSGLDDLVNAELCKQYDAVSIDDGNCKAFSYGVGRNLSRAVWGELIKTLDFLQTKRKMAIVVIAHDRVVEFSDPSQDNYMRYTPNLHVTGKGDGVGKDITRWCDEVLHLSYVTHTRGDSDKEVVKAIGSGKRVIRTEERPSHDAKNRLGLPYEILLPVGVNGYDAIYGIEDKDTK